MSGVLENWEKKKIIHHESTHTCITNSQTSQPQKNGYKISVLTFG